MSEFFDSLMTGLHEAVAIERGELQGLRPKAFPNGQAVQLQCRAEKKTARFVVRIPKQCIYIIGQLRTVLRVVYCRVTLNYPRQRRNNPRNQFEQCCLPAAVCTGNTCPTGWSSERYRKSVK